jgi:hypothetical protein
MPYGKLEMIGIWGFHSQNCEEEEVHGEVNVEMPSGNVLYERVLAVTSLAMDGSYPSAEDLSNFDFISSMQRLRLNVGKMFHRCLSRGIPISN